MSSTPLLLKIGHWFYVNTRFGRWYFNRSVEQVAANNPFGHSTPLNLDYGDYHVRIVSYSRDNYGFIVWRDNSKKCIVIDPGYFPPFKEALVQLNLKIDVVFITHKHVDHCGGLESIISSYPKVKIYSHKRDKVKYTNNTIDGRISSFIVCEEAYLNPIYCTAFNVPGHTVGHTVYCISTSLTQYIDDAGSNPILVFTGDSIFVGSIGAVFECSTEINLNSLKFLVKHLLKWNIPANRIFLFPGHEYSTDSLKFILYNIAPNSTSALAKLDWCIEQRNWRLPTIPTTLLDELSYSPYLRIACAPKTEQNRLNMRYINSKNRIVHKYLPTIKELLNEFLLTEKFIKANTRRNNDFIQKDKIRVKLFDDLFVADKKILLHCDKCSPKSIGRQRLGIRNENNVEPYISSYCNSNQ